MISSKRTTGEFTLVMYVQEQSPGNGARKPRKNTMLGAKWKRNTLTRVLIGKPYPWFSLEINQQIYQDICIENLVESEFQFTKVRY